MLEFRVKYVRWLSSVDVCDLKDKRGTLGLKSTSRSQIKKLISIKYWLDEGLPKLQRVSSILFSLFSPRARPEFVVLWPFWDETRNKEL